MKTHNQYGHQCLVPRVRVMMSGQYGEELSLLFIKGVEHPPHGVAQCRVPAFLLCNQLSKELPHLRRPVSLETLLGRLQLIVLRRVAGEGALWYLQLEAGLARAPVRDGLKTISTLCHFFND